MSMSRVGASWRWRGWDAALWGPAAVPGTGDPVHRVAAATAQRSKTSVEEGSQDAVDNMAYRALASVGRTVL